MSALGWIAAELPAPDRDPRRVGRVVHEVLARHQYRRPTPSTIDRVWSEVVDRVASFLSRVVGAGVGAWFVVAVVLALVVLAAWRFGRGTSLERGRAFPATASVGRTAEDWRAEADAHERAGEWRRALRCRYRALVAELADRGIVDEVPGRTAGGQGVGVAVAGRQVCSFELEPLRVPIPISGRGLRAGRTRERGPRDAGRGGP